MIITKTPFRISFFGGGSDLKEFYSKSPGAVISTSIDKFMYLSSHPFFSEDEIRVRYSQIETVPQVGQLKHPILREVLKKFRVGGALEISSNADIPAGTGLGSSSAFTVGLLQNMYLRFGKYVTKKNLAEEACDMEIEKLKEPIGKQDQYACAFGGLNVFHFHSTGAVSAEPINLSPSVSRTLQTNLLLFYTGQQRSASTLLSEQKANMASQQKIDVLKKMVDLVYQGREALSEQKLDDFGRLLHESWMLKKSLASGVTNSLIEELYQRAMTNGALGGKILGAGGGGFLLVYCDQAHQKRLLRAMGNVRRLDFKFEMEGSRPVYVGDSEDELPKAVAA